jgi:hypothetical protein
MARITPPSTRPTAGKSPRAFSGQHSCFQLIAEATQIVLEAPNTKHHGFERTSLLIRGLYRTAV